MPLINGVKMACEPCIRGHRTASCNHAGERVMLPVRKPGRPLRSCPHQKGRPCDCKEIKVAAQRSPTCSCAAKKPSGSASGDDSIVATSSPLSPPPPDMAASRAADQAYSASLSPDRSIPLLSINSMDPALFERVGAGQDWGEPPPSLQPEQSNVFYEDSSPPFHSRYTNNAMSYAESKPIGGLGTVGLHSPSISARSRRPSATSQETIASGIETPLSTLSSNAERSRSNSFTHGLTEPQVTPGGFFQPSEQFMAQTSQKVPSTPRYPAQSPQEGIAPRMAQQPPLFHGSEARCRNCFTPIQQMQQPEGPMYMPAYGSNLPPPTDLQWQIGPGGYIYIIIPPPPAVHQPWICRTAENAEQPAPGDLEPILECDCGPNCQCIGCTTHPFNQATQGYVASAYNHMVDTLTQNNRVGGSVSDVPSQRLSPRPECPPNTTWSAGR